MKTLSSLLMVVMGMLFLVPRVTKVDFEETIDTEIILPYEEPDNIRKTKQNIELLKSEIGVIISEVKLKMPYKA